MNIMTNDKDLFSQLEMEENIKVPQSRIGVLIGKKGETKLYIEEKTKTKLTIDSENGLVTIRPSKNIDDPLLVWIARDIVKSIARGFSEEKAYKLLDDDYYLDIITIEEDNKNRLNQIKGRIIGEGGRTRRIIEQSTKSYISVQGKTIAMIGLHEELPITKKSVEMLLSGQRHGTVYKFLERHRIQKKKERTQIWQKKIEFKDDPNLKT